VIFEADNANQQVEAKSAKLNFYSFGAVGFTPDLRCCQTIRQYLKWHTAAKETENQMFMMFFQHLRNTFFSISDTYFCQLVNDRILSL
jgi:hypothetical protein